MGPMAIKIARDTLPQVSDVMTAIVGVIDDSATVKEAAETLADLGVTGAPVVKDERVVGVVSHTDLLIAPDDAPVTDVMTETVFAVRPSDSVLLAARLMVEQRIHRVIVVNEAGDMHGVLSSMDALGALTAAFGGSGDLGYVNLRDDGS